MNNGQMSFCFEGHVFLTCIQGVPERSIRYTAARMPCTVNTKGHNTEKYCDKCSLIRSLQNSIDIFLMFNSY